MAVHFDNSKEHTRGDTGLYTVSLYDEEGTEYIPDAAETLTFYLMKKYFAKIQKLLRAQQDGTIWI